MKAQERKALEANSLQKGLEQAIEGVKHGPSSALLFWIGAVVLIVLGYVLFTWFLSSANETGSARWMAVADAAFPSQVDGLLEKSDLKDTPQGRLARFQGRPRQALAGPARAGQQAHLVPGPGQRGHRPLRGTAQECGPSAPAPPGSTVGRGQGHEAQGNYDRAKQLYGNLVKDHAASALGKDAEKRLKRLDDPAAQKDLDDLRKEFGSSEGRTN